MAPILSSLLTLALLSLTAQAGLHNTRSRQHSAQLAARRVQVEESDLSVRDTLPANVSTKFAGRSVSGEEKKSARKSKRGKKAKRCSKHSSSSTPKPTSSSSQAAATSAAAVTTTSKAAPAPTSSKSQAQAQATSSSAAAAAASSSASSSGSESGLTYTGVPSGSLSGDLTGGIASWFQADSSRDSTNGKSWCGISYTDDMPLFAAKFSLISPSKATWSSDASQWEADGAKWCGMEAEVTYNGNTVKMYLGDAFDDSWVRTEYSIDVLKGVWQTLANTETDNKDDVLSGVSWKFTGYQNPDYKFQG